MSEPNKCCPVLSNASVPPPNLTSDVPSFRNVGPSTSTMNPAPPGPPALPPRPDMSMTQNYGMNSYNSYGGMGSYGMGGMGSYGGYGYGGYSGGYGMGGMGMGMSPYGYNRFGGGPMYGDIESRFIQIAEENTRPTFDSIQSLVHAVGSVAMMLENTFFALTSSFRAILGVAENFGRLRSLFAQFWSTFAVVRSLNWLIRKLSVMLGIRTESEFKAWAEAVAATQPPPDPNRPQPPRASWPVLLFFGVLAAAPYIVLRMLNGISSSIHEKLYDPKTWQNPLRAVAQYDYTATSPQEISFNASQVITLAPQHLQGHLWNSGWLVGSTDRQTAGLLPVTYIKVIKPAEETKKEEKQTKVPDNVDLDKIYNQEL